MDYPKHTYIYFNGISDVSKQPDEPEPEVPSIPFDVQLASDLYADTVRGMSRLLGNAMSALVLVFALA